MESQNLLFGEIVLNLEAIASSLKEISNKMDLMLEAINPNLKTSKRIVWERRLDNNVVFQVPYELKEYFKTTVRRVLGKMPIWDNATKTWIVGKIKDEQCEEIIRRTFEMQKNDLEDHIINLRETKNQEEALL